ncbi:hypothetical protein EK21DRAFT_114026 [Setomelanomma holmii]|uniref:Uncharacterized protein n=1 Tax=Setomelanomma holmii TaxID=210430 RepID=A0A9P4H7A2_9PLEO|nr:hypothetical protein EK21DRAFT_114026 [Setomelanomma holmii]
MAPLTGASMAATSGDWLWSPEHDSYYKTLYGADGSYRYMWPSGHTPRLSPQSSTPTIGAVYADMRSYDRCYQRLDTPRSSTSTPDSSISDLSASVPITHSPSNPIDRPKVPTYVLRYQRFPIEWRTVPDPDVYRIAQNLPPDSYYSPSHQGPVLWRPPSAHYVMGFCDYEYCYDPYCIETQYETQGFRDDLKHHEDQDKNGNMRDGDKAANYNPMESVTQPLQPDFNEDYIVVYPFGLDFQAPGVQWLSEPAAPPSSVLDDRIFITELLAYLTSTLYIDKSRL